MIAVKRFVLLILILSFCLPWLPWWCGILICAIDGFISYCQKCSALRGGISLGTVWTGAILWKYSIGSELLMNRVAGMMGLEYGVYLAMIMVLLAIILGCLGGYTGSQLRVQFIQNPG